MKKKLSLLLIAILIIPNISFASGNLSYDEAVKTAIKNNLNLERLTDTINYIDDTLEKGISTDDEEKDISTIISNSMKFENLLNDKKINETSYDSQKEALKINIKDIFSKIEYLEKNKTLITKKITNMNKTISINSVRYAKGLISKIDYDESMLELDKLKNSLKENELKTKTAYKELSNIIGSKNNSKIKYLDIKYTPLTTLQISKQQMVGIATSESTNIIAKNNQIKMLEEQIKYDLLDNSYLPRSEQATNVQIQDVELRQSKQNIENIVLETANALENMELNIKDLNNQLENSTKQYRNAELLVKLGIKTKKELEDMNITIEQMKLNLENMIDEHQILLEKYQKPYLLSL